MPTVWIQVYGPFPDEDAVYDLARAVMADGLRASGAKTPFGDVGEFRDEIVRCHVAGIVPTFVGEGDDRPAVHTVDFLHRSGMGFQRTDPPTETDPSRFTFRPQGGDTVVSGVADWRSRTPMVGKVDPAVDPDAAYVIDYVRGGRSPTDVVPPAVFDALRERRRSAMAGPHGTGPTP